MLGSINKVYAVDIVSNLRISSREQLLCLGFNQIDSINLSIPHNIIKLTFFNTSLYRFTIGHIYVFVVGTCFFHYVV